jgi:hypothetical protein
MSEIVYEASVYTRTVKYRNFKGEEKKVTLYFALDPLQLMTFIAGFETKKIKSGNPARNGQASEMSAEEQLKFVRSIAVKAAGTPSEDGESWTPFEGFEDDLAGKAFLTKLAASDGDRKEFAEVVILAPFRAFTQFAEADPSNSPADVKQFTEMLTQVERIFAAPDPVKESLEERRARLIREMEALDGAPGVDGDRGIDNPTQS